MLALPADLVVVFRTFLCAHVFAAQKLRHEMVDDGVTAIGLSLSFLLPPIVLSLGQAQPLLGICGDEMVLRQRSSSMDVLHE